MSNLESPPRSRSFLAFVQDLLAAHWQTLLLLLVGVCLPLFIFEQLAIAVYQNGGFDWDVAILQAIHKTSQPTLDRIALITTPFGVYQGVLPVTIAISIGLLYQQRWRSCVYLLTTLIGSAFINRTAKAFLHRARPTLWESVSPHSDFAFPSGHAMASMSLVVALVILTWGTRWCWFVALFGAGFAAAIAWTRLYLGVHFPSDILAGWMVSLAWASGVSLVIRPHLNRAKLRSEETSLSLEEAETVNEFSSTQGR